MIGEKIAIDSDITINILKGFLVPCLAYYATHWPRIHSISPAALRISSTVSTLILISYCTKKKEERGCNRSGGTGMCQKWAHSYNNEDELWFMILKGGRSEKWDCTVHTMEANAKYNMMIIHTNLTL